MSRILVVDDEPTLVATVKFNLEKEGYEVIAASDGEQALPSLPLRRPRATITTRGPVRTEAMSCQTFGASQR